MNWKEVKIQGLKMEELDEVTQMVIDSFQTNNAFSKEGLETKEELQFRIRVSINLFYNYQQKFNEERGTNLQFIQVVKYSGKIIAMVMGCELRIFFSQLLPMIDPQDPYIQVFKYMNPNDYEKDTAVLGSMLTVHKDFMKYQLSKYLIDYSIKYAIDNGFKYFFGTATNPISRKISLNYGGKILKELTINRNGKDGTITLIMIKIQDMVKAIKNRPKL